ncbi:hypothetical protein T439DRAFT_357455 [Meredithblackwellia eburnea MCA 4105]
MSIKMQFPDIEFFAFVPPLFLQCLLLHPVFPDSLSRPLRAVLTVPTLNYAFTTPFKHGFEPRETNVASNFVLGIAASYAIFKTLEFGLVTDLLPYTWVGLDSDQEAQVKQPAKDGKEPQLKLVPLRHDRARLEARRRKAAESDSPIAITINTLHLLFSMRGLGYAFGPSVKSLKRTAYPSEPVAFFLRNLRELVWSHVCFASCLAVITTPPSLRQKFIQSLIPNLAPQLVEAFPEFTNVFALGLGAYSGLSLGYTFFTMSIQVISVLPIPFMPSFDPRQYHRLFYQVWNLESVAKFWTVHWHNYFARSFKFLGLDPTVALVEYLGGGSVLARVLGVLVVFGMSGWLHEQYLLSNPTAIYSATSHLPEFNPPLSFITRWGGTGFFLLQGVAILLEQTFTAATGRKVRGPLGALWTLAWLGGAGYFVWNSWSTLGLFSALPPPDKWGWQRAVIPIMSLAPPPYFIRA